MPTTLPAEPLDEAGDRLDRPARREHVVVDDDARAVGDRVGGDLERVLAVLEHVAAPCTVSGGSLPGPPRRHEAAAGLLRDRRAEIEAARLGAEDRGRAPAPPSRRRARRRPARSAAVVEQERRDVLEADPGLREVLDLADVALQVERRSLADESMDVAREEELGQLLRGLRQRLEVLDRRRGAAPGCARGAPARRAPRAAPTRGRPRCGTRADGAARCRSARACRTRSRRRDPSPSRGAARRSTRGSSRPNSSSSRARAGVDARRARRARRGRVPPRPRRARPRRRRRSFPAPAASSSRITRSGRNSSRCRRRIVSSRSTSSSPKSR